MNIESEIFKKCRVDRNKLEDYGFTKNDENYIYKKNFLNDKFQAFITIDKKGTISGKVIDLQMDDEYTNIRTEMVGDFVSSVRESYKDILKDIKKNCFTKEYFIGKQTNRITKYIIKKIS